jgi:aminoglycoside phosphotransferase family enzyme/predicted kinase
MSAPSLALAEAAYAACAAEEVRETHISWVFLSGDSAYKLKKPIVLPFLDYGTHERRRWMCEEEVRLNRRLAPTVYRGVLALVPDGDGLRLDHEDHPDAIEHVVWMRRFDECRTLAALAPDDPDVEAVAARLAEFHALAPPIAGIDPVASVAATAAETFGELSDLPATAAARRFTEAFLMARGRELRAREEAGLVRGGHGDLRAEHVLMERQVEVVDCVEFDAALRAIDVGADLAFLVMDLERLGRGDLARRLVRAYREHGGDPGDDALIAFHAAQRAWVRAKVALIRGRDGEVGELMDVGRRLSWGARQPLMLLVCGLSGTGKSTLARELGRASGTQVLSSDVVRKELAGLAPTEHGPPELYTPEFSRRTYAELGRRADRALCRCGLVVVDATFREASDRDAFCTGVGWRLGGETRGVECTASPELRAARTAARVGDPSDATPAVAAAQRFEPLADEHLVLETDRPVEELAGAVEAWLDATLAAPRG